jgi:hypothetical protein
VGAKAVTKRWNICRLARKESREARGTLFECW